MPPLNFLGCDIMPLSDEQLEEMLEKVIQDNTNIKWIRDDLEKGSKKFIELRERIVTVEGEQSLLKGRIGAFVLFLTLCGTILVQGIGWIISHFWSAKGAP